MDFIPGYYLGITFSQSGYLDETIPKKISSDLKHDLIFKSYDNGSFLEYLEEITQITGGNVIYYSIAHGNSMLK
jgi:asparagine synthase (glutamine-hydrolysing)